MNKTITLAIAILFVASIFVGALAIGMGPAPNSGDGIPDGSGFDRTDLPTKGIGPAPNSGDGIPDGSGF